MTAQPPALMIAADQELTRDRRCCAVFMPMLPSFEAIRLSVARAVAAAGFEMLRLEVEVEDAFWHLWLLDALQHADVALVDLTSHNPYVMYEMGCVHQRSLPAAYIMDTRDERITASVRGNSFTPYGDARGTFEARLAHDLQQLHHAAGDWLPSVEWLQEADHWADAFDRAQGRPCPRVVEPVFAARLHVAMRRGQPDPRRMAASARAKHLLACRLAESERVEVMLALCRWCDGLR